MTHGDQGHGNGRRDGEDPQSQRERVRQRLAFALLGILAGTILSAFVAYGLETTGTEPAPGQTIKDLMTLIFTPLVGLVGAATGFYYGTSERRSDSND